MTQIGMGAEAILTRTPEGIVKSRPPKPYRHVQLDNELRKSRTRHEARILEKAKAIGVSVPDVKVVDETTLLLSEAPGLQVKELLDADPLIAHQIGRLVAKLHDANIIHADLTTSNMLYDSATHHLTIIDFGLSYISQKDEDKAVDLHLFKQSLESKHHRVILQAYRHFLKGYRDSHNAENVIDRLRKVEARGRNKGS
jgi:TP53 regulating kinase and related kinases